MIQAGGKLSGVDLGRWVCAAIDGPNESVVRMRSLGICVGRPLDLVCDGDPMIVRVGSTQIGLSRFLAKHVTVQPRSESLEPVEDTAS
jgi:Fe2+ transport system protein FeoA